MIVNRVCLCGLGNPGPEYRGQYHNFGAQAVEDLAVRRQLSFTQHTKTKVQHVIDVVGSFSVHFIQLPVYMNLSGMPVRKYLDFYEIPFENLVVFHDELDLAFSELRLKFAGGSGGHNGLKDITKHLATDRYWRVRMGIGRPLHPEMDVADFVLSRPSLDRISQWNGIVDRIFEVFPAIIDRDLQKVAHQWHRKP